MDGYYIVFTKVNVVKALLPSGLFTLLLWARQRKVRGRVVSSWERPAPHGEMPQSGWLPG